MPVALAGPTVRRDDVEIDPKQRQPRGSAEALVFLAVAGCIVGRRVVGAALDRDGREIELLHWVSVIFVSSVVESSAAADQLVPAEVATAVAILSASWPSATL